MFLRKIVLKPHSKLEIFSGSGLCGANNRFKANNTSANTGIKIKNTNKVFILMYKLNVFK